MSVSLNGMMCHVDPLELGDSARSVALLRSSSPCGGWSSG